jgi:hypothetical protein
MRYPGKREAAGDRDCVENYGDDSFAIFADGFLDERALAFSANDGADEDPVGDARHEEDDAVERSGIGCEAGSAHPGGDDRQQREPEEQMEVGPEACSRW